MAKREIVVEFRIDHAPLLEEQAASYLNFLELAFKLEAISLEEQMELNKNFATLLNKVIAKDLKILTKK